MKNGSGDAVPNADTIPSPPPVDEDERPTWPDVPRPRSSDRAIRLSELRALLSKHDNAPTGAGEESS